MPLFFWCYTKFGAIVFFLCYNKFGAIFGLMLQFPINLVPFFVWCPEKFLGHFLFDVLINFRPFFVCCPDNFQAIVFWKIWWGFKQEIKTAAQNLKSSQAIKKKDSPS